MTDFWTILGGVAGAVFSPLLTMLLTGLVALALIVLAASSIESAPWWECLLWWAGAVSLTVFAVALIVFLLQLQPFAWVVAS